MREYGKPKGILANGCTKKWTQEAKDCFERNCNCDMCFIKGFEVLNKKCRMKEVVRELLWKFGKPPKVILNNKVKEIK